MASLSEQRGLDAGKKQTVARMGFLGVPIEGRERPWASPGSSSQHTATGGGGAVLQYHLPGPHLFWSCWTPACLDWRRLRTAQSAGQLT